jgi:two-component system, NarL family, response regulator LiaR
MSNELISTLVVEDHEITRLGLKKMLEQLPNMVVVAEAGDGMTAVAKVQEFQPDLVLMDIGLPGIDGIEATKRIKASCNTKVVMITSHEEDEGVFTALSAGADAYCLKGVSVQKLSHAIVSVLDGAVWLDPGIARRVVQAMTKGTVARSSSDAGAKGHFGLSKRELDVLELLVSGSTNQQMADRLYLSTETIKTHMRHIMEKLGVVDRTQAAVKAVTLRLTAPVLAPVDEFVNKKE